MMRQLESVYCWLWFHTEFWLTPVDRRPFTFIMQDYIYSHPKETLTMVVLWYAALVALGAFGHWLVAMFLGIFSSLILAHLVWGVKYIEGQQECPPYIE